jgi:hypothetical protein
MQQRYADRIRHLARDLVHRVGTDQQQVRTGGLYLAGLF